MPRILPLSIIQCKARKKKYFLRQHSDQPTSNTVKELTSDKVQTSSNVLSEFQNLMKKKIVEDKFVS